MSINAMDVARQILYSRRLFNCKDVTNLKLQKLIFFSEVTSLCLSGESLFPERLEAWKLGPVVSAVYHKYKRFDRVPIVEDGEPTTNKYLENITYFVMSVFGLKSAPELVDITHKEYVYKKAYSSYKRGGSNVMNVDRQTANEIILRETQDELTRAAFASLRGKILPNENHNLPSYIDDYSGVSEEERLKIWGITDIED